MIERSTRNPLIYRLQVRAICDIKNVASQRNNAVDEQKVLAKAKMLATTLKKL
jgi:hypothetical protein